MRIISGEFRGRQINVPQSKHIRPTTDRVRETLFNLLNNRIDFDGIKVLDIYSGSGSLGLECISRGAAGVNFIEKNFFISKNLEENISLLKVKDKCKVYKIEAVKFSELEIHEQYDLVLADPPFFKDDIYTVVKNLLQNKFLKEEGFIIVERSIQTKQKDMDNFGEEPFRIIGDACLYQISYE